jgi:tetratricopeptide (TPR) repeat protein
MIMENLKVLTWRALAVMAAQTGYPAAPPFMTTCARRLEYLKANDPNSAAKEFEAVLALDPKNAEAYANLGVIAFFKHDYKNASQYLRKALAIEPALVKTQGSARNLRKKIGTAFGAGAAGEIVSQN